MFYVTGGGPRGVSESKTGMRHGPCGRRFRPNSAECRYIHKESGMYSPDGHTRPFDAHARGTVFGSGIGVVVLKPLQMLWRTAIRYVRLSEVPQ